MSVRPGASKPSTKLSASALSYLSSLETNSKALQNSLKNEKTGKVVPSSNPKRGKLDKLRTISKSTTIYESTSLDSDDQLSDDSFLKNSMGGEKIILDLGLDSSEVTASILPKGKPGNQVGRKSLVEIRELRNSIDQSLKPALSLLAKKNEPKASTSMSKALETGTEKISPQKEKKNMKKSPFNKKQLSDSSSDLESLVFQVASDIPEQLNLNERRVSFKAEELSSASSITSRSISSTSNSASEVPDFTARSVASTSSTSSTLRSASSSSTSTTTNSTSSSTTSSSTSSSSTIKKSPPKRKGRSAKITSTSSSTSSSSSTPSKASSSLLLPTRSLLAIHVPEEKEIRTRPESELSSLHSEQEISDDEVKREENAKEQQEEIRKTTIKEADIELTFGERTQESNQLSTTEQRMQNINMYSVSVNREQSTQTSSRVDAIKHLPSFNYVEVPSDSSAVNLDYFVKQIISQHIQLIRKSNEDEWRSICEWTRIVNEEIRSFQPRTKQRLMETIEKRYKTQ
ncbi:unnamed protein product [Auanema sp. JU1783]|nr:unnamed protein product [Auanema sp. JU1783]